MSDELNSVVDHAFGGKVTSFEKAVNAQLTTRAQAAIDQHRVEYAQALFSGDEEGSYADLPSDVNPDDDSEEDVTVEEEEQLAEGPDNPKPGDEKRFKKKHVTFKHDDANKNKDDVFQAKNIKAVERDKERHGYNPGEDEKIYE